MTKRTLQIDVTDACNLSCNYCYNKSILNQGNYLKPAKIINWYNKIKRANSDEIYTVYIGGGEPLLSNYLWEILDFFYRMSDVRKIVLSTNGTMWDQSIERWLYLCQDKHKISVQVSLPAIKNYERITGRDAKDEVLSNIKRYKKICNVQLNMPIYFQNLEDLKSILDFVYQVKLPLRLNKVKGIPLGIPEEKLEYEINQALFNHMAMAEGWIIKTLDACEDSECCRDTKYLMPNGKESGCPFIKFLERKR